MKRVAIIAMLIAAGLSAKNAVAGENAPLPALCMTHKTASIHLVFNATGNAPSALRRDFNTAIKTVQIFATENGITKMIADGVNYTIHESPARPASDDIGDVKIYSGSAPALEGTSVRDSITYQLSGFANLSLEPPAKGLQLLKLLEQKHYDATLNFVEYNEAPGQCALDARSGEWQ